jgi:hypothetical protein
MTELRWNSQKLTSPQLAAKLARLSDEEAMAVELIDLYNNRLAYLPYDLLSARFGRLLDLDVSHNQLRFISSRIGLWRLEGLYTSANPGLGELQEDTHTLEGAGKLINRIVTSNRSADRATAGAVLVLCESRYGTGPISQLPKDVVVLLARCIWNNY